MRVVTFHFLFRFGDKEATQSPQKVTSNSPKTNSSNESTPVHNTSNFTNGNENMCIPDASSIKVTSNKVTSNKFTSRLEMPTQSASIPKTQNPILSTPKTTWDGNCSTKIEEMTDEPQPRRFYKVTKL